MRDAYSIAELVDLGPAKRSTLYALIAEGRLVARKLNGRTVVLRKDWEAFLEELPVLPPRSPSNASQQHRSDD